MAVMQRAYMAGMWWNSKAKAQFGGVKAGRRPVNGPGPSIKGEVASYKGRPIENRVQKTADNTVSLPGPYSTKWGNYSEEMIRVYLCITPSCTRFPAGTKASDGHLLGSDDGLESKDTFRLILENHITHQQGNLEESSGIRDPETGAYDLASDHAGQPDEYNDDEWGEIREPTSGNDPKPTAQRPRNK
ncbi:hypothetical protein Tco_0795386 [Tanacetum coccineum]